MVRLLFRSLLVAVGIGAIAAMPAGAQSYPSKPIKIVVPYGAGAGVDIEARIVANFLGTHLKQSVFIENRPGASSLIGTEAVVRSEPDGYTLLWTTGSLATFPALYNSLKFDPLRDLEPVSLAANFGTVLGVGKKVPVANYKEFVAYAKANPGKLNYASTGPGVIYMGIEALKREAGLSMVEIPYPGGQGAYSKAMLAGEVQFVMLSLSVAKQLHDEGQLTVLMALDDKRFPQLPNVPTAAELGLKTVIASSWHGLLAPKGTPKPVLETISKGVAAYMNSADAKKRAETSVFLPVGSTPDEFRRVIEKHTQTWTEIGAALKIAKQ